MIRVIEFNVSSDGIEPSVRVAAGIQGEHNATVLSFLLRPALFSALQAQKKEGDSLRYRFDAFDGTGCALRAKSESLENDELNYYVTSQLSKYGGNAEVFLVITLLRNDNTELELLSYPARLYFKAGVNFGEEGSRESLTTLEQNAAAAALKASEASERAEEAALTAESAKNASELARSAIESGSEFLFDGGNADCTLPIQVAVDEELSVASSNPVQNSAIALQFKETQLAINQKTDSNTVSEMIAEALEEAKGAIIAEARKQALLAAYPIGSLYITLSGSHTPADELGGSWERIAKGKTLVGAMESGDASYDSDFSLGKTGGEKEHTLTVGELPTHSHSVQARLAERVAVTGSDWSKQAVDGNNLTSTGAVGESKAHNNMPPYLAVNIWKRVG